MLCAVRLVLCMMTLCYLQALHPWLQSLAFELPNPRLDFKLCGGDLTEPKWICDPDHVLHEPEGKTYYHRIIVTTLTHVYSWNLKTGLFLREVT